MITHSKILNEKLPGAQFRSQVSVMIHCDPRAAIAAFEEVTPRDMPLARRLGEIRYLPGRLIGRKVPRADLDQSFGKQLKDMGTREIYRDSHEIATGSAGKLHQITDQEFFQFKTNEELFQFRDPSYQKLFISVRAEEISPGLSLLTLEHWTEALSPKSERQFARYWVVIRPMGNFVSKILLNAARRRAESVQRNSDVVHQN